MSGDPFIAFQGGNPDDTRFQFDVIKHLSESVRQLAAGMAEMQRTQVGMLERLATLEANKVGEVVGKMDGKLEAMDARIDVLMRDKDRRDGATGLLQRVPSWLQFAVAVASIFTAIYLAGRSAGIVPAPPAAPVRVEANIHPEDRKIEGVVGGKP